MIPFQENNDKRLMKGCVSIELPIFFFEGKRKKKLVTILLSLGFVGSGEAVQGVLDAILVNNLESIFDDF